MGTLGQRFKSVVKQRNYQTMKRAERGVALRAIKKDLERLLLFVNRKLKK